MPRYPQYDKSFGGYRLFIGNIGERVGKYDLEPEFDRYGPLIDIWVARNPPGFAYVVYKHEKDAEYCVRKMHGRRICGSAIRVEYAKPYPGPAPNINYIPRKRSRTRSLSPRDRSRSRSRSPRKRSRSPRRRSRSPRRRSRSPRRSSPSPRRRSPSPRRKSPSPSQRSRSRSPERNKDRSPSPERS